ncbi:sensor histidine kinase [Methylophaga sp.]|uniref:sensor histidine kinase n=2 Tax=unclassified Methylophaga TaxID=2629249 RepID=UPI003A9451A8
MIDYEKLFKAEFWPMSLRGLINLRIVMSVFVIILLGASMTIWQARESVREEVSSSYNLALQMVEFGLNQFTRNMHTEGEWIEHISRLRETRHLQISVYDENGRETTLSRRGDGVQRARPPEWFVSAVMTDTISSTYEIKLPNDAIQRIVITADPLDEINEAWGESLVYFWSIVLMLGIIFLAINVVFHSMLKAVQTILSGLKNVESGNYEEHLPSFRISEFDAIATEVNNLTDALSVARRNNQALARHTMQIQETERRHLSRELHDEMGQSLTAVKAMAVATKQPDAEVNKVADSIIEICNHLSGVVRSMMRTLHPLSLSDLGLYATLTDLVNEWKRRQPILKIDLNCEPSVDELDEEVSIHVYRIVQECLTNVVRHAKADRVNVIVRPTSIKDEHRITILVEDNGVGGGSTGDGFGLLAMRERVQSMGGEFIFESTRGRGVRIRVWMPFIEKKHDK